MTLTASEYHKIKKAYTVIDKILVKYSKKKVDMQALDEENNGIMQKAAADTGALEALSHE